MVVIAGQRRLDAEVREQMLRVPGILRGDQFDFFENPQGAQSNVFEIADGSRDDVENAGHRQRQRFETETGLKKIYRFIIPLSIRAISSHCSYKAE